MLTATLRTNLDLHISDPLPSLPLEAMLAMQVGDYVVTARHTQLVVVARNFSINPSGEGVVEIELHMPRHGQSVSEWMKAYEKRMEIGGTTLTD